MPSEAAMQAAKVMSGHALAFGVFANAAAIELFARTLDAFAAQAIAAAEAAARADVADELRAEGWMVAVHNDYRINGERHTFWLFTRGNECVKGEGRTDAEALAQCAALARAPAPATEGK